jgi:signal transduction histidine kinase
VTVAAEIEASDLGRRIAAKGQPAEVQKLADTFDAMLARLEHAFQDQRNFVLDVSHDLRTPLAALRGNIDVLLMSDSLDTETRAQLEHMSAETGRLIRLTTNLLYMASADSGRQAERRPVELDVVCLEVYRQVKDLRADVGVRNEDQLTVMGDRDLLKQMLLNLAENAVKYSQREGSVTLFCSGATAQHGSSSKTQVRVSLQTSCPTSSRGFIGAITAVGRADQAWALPSRVGSLKFTAGTSTWKASPAAVASSVLSCR